jgi:hypothetical protein
MSFVELAILFVVALLALAVGRRVLVAAGCEFHTPAGAVAAQTALGLGIIAYVVLAVGLLGHLTVVAVVMVLFSVLVLTHAPVVGHFAQASYRLLCRFVPGRVTPVHADTPPHRSPLPRGRGRGRTERTAEEFSLAPGRGGEGWGEGASGLGLKLGCGLLVGVAMMGTLAGALAPPTAGDALCYHLEIPKRFVQMGEICFLPLTDNSLFPFLMEMLYTLGLLLSGPVLAQLFHWLVGLLFAGAVVELATPHVGRASGVLSGAVALLVPCVTNQMTAPLNDLAVALYCTLMVIGCERWYTLGQRRWLVLCAVFGGLALSVKLVSAAMVVPVGSLVALRAWSGRGWRPAWRPAAVFAAVVVLTGGVWYARSWHHLGNPIYPYFNSWFGLDPHTRSTLQTSDSLLAVPWAATMHPERFGGRGMQFGALFLALLPGLAVVPRVSRDLARLIGLAVVFGLAWFGVRQDLRFLLPVVPMMSVAGVAVLRGLSHSHRPAFAAACVCTAALLAFQTLIVVKRSRACWAVALSLESRADYLERHEPTYQVARFVNTQLGKDCRVISQDYRGLYFDPDFVREASLRRQQPYAQQGDDLARWLADTGFTHILLVESFNPETAVYDQGFAERLGPATGRLREVFATRFESASGDRREYRLFALPARSVPLVSATPLPTAAMAN